MTLAYLSLGQLITFGIAVVATTALIKLGKYLKSRSKLELQALIFLFGALALVSAIPVMLSSQIPSLPSHVWSSLPYHFALTMFGKIWRHYHPAPVEDIQAVGQGEAPRPPPPQQPEDDWDDIEEEDEDEYGSEMNVQEDD